MGAISNSALCTVSPVQKGHHIPFPFLQTTESPFPSAIPQSEALQEGTGVAIGHHGAGAAPHFWDAASNFIRALLNCYRHNNDPRRASFPHPWFYWAQRLSGLQKWWHSTEDRQAFNNSSVLSALIPHQTCRGRNMAHTGSGSHFASKSF